MDSAVLVGCFRNLTYLLIAIVSLQDYDVEIILDVKNLESASPMFLVKWAGYNDPSDNTWEPVSMFAFDLLKYDWANARLKAQARKHSHKWKQ